MHDYRLSVDIGGTFTDVVLSLPDGTLHSVKSPTTPDNPVLGAIAGITQLLDQTDLCLSKVDLLVHGTTLATNTLIEKKGAKTGAILTKGFKDILEIGYERRYNQDDLNIDKPDLIIPREHCLTVKERISANGGIIHPLDKGSVLDALQNLVEQGVETVAVCLLHAYANAQHEQGIEKIIQDVFPNLSVSLSSGVSPEIREFDRLCTTAANAYIKPLMSDYLLKFKQALTTSGFQGTFFMMTSAGGMTTLQTARQYPIRLVESGPSGGAILAAKIAQQCGLEKIVSFDMGGTTAKFCMIDNAKPRTTRNFEAARAERFCKGSGIPLRIPAIEMIEIGAGGGSVAGVDKLQRITIGPHSMGAEPGPSCYGRGGTMATVTDADAVLGHVNGDSFISSDIQFDLSNARNTISECVGAPLKMQASDAAYGISQMVGENMANAGRVHAAECGTNLSDRSMIAFGGNGPLHAARVAEKMGVSQVIIPKDPGVGSAVGFLSAPISYESVVSYYTTLDNFNFEMVNKLLRNLINQTQNILNVDDSPVKIRRIAFMRYAGQGHEIEVDLPNRDLTEDDPGILQTAYDDAYRKQFKRTVPGMVIEVMNWALRMKTVTKAESLIPAVKKNKDVKPYTKRAVYFGLEPGEIEVPVFNRDELLPGNYIKGPALISEPQTTTLIPQGFNAIVDSIENLVLNREELKQPRVSQTESKVSIQLPLMWNRLLAVVEEQAQALIRSAFSPIVRECGDISAGIFDRDGRMLAQAVTGTPGHINTMAQGVGNFLALIKRKDMKPGDIFATNDPWIAAGHLNDYMLVQPVFFNQKIIGFTSCTSHLVDVGGLCMGAQGSDIFDEGMRVPPCKLVSNGEVDPLLLNLIKANSRRPIENEGDIYALIACCEVGESRLLSMMNEYGMTSLQTLADHIIHTSQKASLEGIRQLPKGEFNSTLKLDGYDFEINLKARMTVTEDDLTIDFSGSSPCSKFGINVPLNYATAYTVFALRCAIGVGIPNNAGSLAPFKITAPENCIVNATHPSPVAMRHTIGQLLPDIAFGCLEKAIPGLVPAEGASCMYDLPMRNLPNSDKTQFAIELVHNGGTGARPEKDGLSATAFPSGVWGSQVEITECTVPIRVNYRELRIDSGGAGKYRGGLGQILEIESSEQEGILLFLSLDRMKYPARGRDNGSDGAKGHVSLASGEVLSGHGEFVIPDRGRLIFQTPGGGGRGLATCRDPQTVRTDVLQGLVSRSAAQEIYGVILDSNCQVDDNATKKYREEKTHVNPPGTS